MNQNNNTYAIISASVFGLAFIIASIYYFFPSNGDVVWVKIEEALEKSINEDKPILLYTYNKFAAVNKIANQSIFSNDTVVNFIQSNFIPASINLDNSHDLELAKRRYQVDNGQFTVLLDKYGRGITFLDNSWSAGVYKEFAQKAISYPYFKFLYYDEAKQDAAKSSKPMIIFLTTNYYQNISFNEKLSEDDFLQYVNDKFIPVAMMTYEEWDRAILKNLMPENDPVLSYNSEIKQSNLVKFKKSPSEEILLVSPDNKLIGRLVVSDMSNDWITEINLLLQAKQD